ncbi:MAG: FHA domain-containing protein [Planctomycetota bacterium]
MAKPLKLIVEEGGKARALEFEQDVVTIGRTNDNAVKISDALSSRHHCQVSRADDGYWVEDLKSRNGTKLNGAPLKERTLLKPGDRIEVGESYVHFRARRKSGGAAGGDAGEATGPGATKGASRRESRASARKAKAPAGGPAAPGAVQLRTTEGEAKGTVTPLDQLPLVIGRKKGGLSVADADVSNEHAMLVDDGGVLHVVDLGSTNGTFLDGQRVKGRAPLRVGMSVRLGATLTFLLEPAGAAASVGEPVGEPLGSAAADGDDEEVPADAVEEVADLDDLDDLDDEEEPAAPPPKPEKPSQRRKPPTSDRSARSKEPSGEAPDDGAADALVAQESAALEAIEFGDHLEEKEERLRGGGSVGLVLVALALLAVLGSVGYAASRALAEKPSGELGAEENLVSNWSFEELEPQGGGFRGWKLFAKAARQVGAGETRYGKAALGLTLGPDAARAEFHSADPPQGLRVKAGQSYRLRAAVSLDKGTAAALRVDWSADDKADYARQSVAALSQPATQRLEWAALEGLVVAPPGANRATVVGVGLLAGGERGEVRFDRVELLESSEARKLTELPAPGGLVLGMRPRGILSLVRAGEQVAFDFGPTLDPQDRLAGLDAARLDQPLGRQTDESLLALGTLQGAGGASLEYTFTCRPTTDTLRLRWTTAGGDAKALHLAATLERLELVMPLELDGRAVQNLPDEGLEYPQVREMSWGKGEQQLSFRFTSPATIVLRPKKGGSAALTVTMPPSELANGQREVGLDLGAASQRARDALRGLLREARQARRVGQFADAIKAYRAVLAQFPHEKAEVATARQGLDEINQHADRLVEVVRWAHAEADRAPAPPLAAAARSAVAELAQGFPDSPQLTAAKQELQRVEEAITRGERRVQAERVGRLVARAQALRVDGHVRLAREIYTYVIANFPAELSDVAEAKRRLDALPPEGQE